MQVSGTFAFVSLPKTKRPLTLLFTDDELFSVSNEEYINIQLFMKVL